MTRTSEEPPPPAPFPLLFAAVPSFATGSISRIASHATVGTTKTTQRTLPPGRPIVLPTGPTRRSAVNPPTRHIDLQNLTSGHTRQRPRRLATTPTRTPSDVTNRGAPMRVSPAMKKCPPCAPVTVTSTEATPAGTVNVSDPTRSYVHVVPDSRPAVPHGSPTAAGPAVLDEDSATAEATSPVLSTHPRPRRTSTRHDHDAPRQLPQTTRHEFNPADPDLRGNTAQRRCGSTPPHTQRERSSPKRATKPGHKLYGQKCPK